MENLFGRISVYVFQEGYAKYKIDYKFHESVQRICRGFCLPLFIFWVLAIIHAFKNYQSEYWVLPIFGALIITIFLALSIYYLRHSAYIQNELAVRYFLAHIKRNNKIVPSERSVKVG